MWIYEKKLIYPLGTVSPDLRFGKLLLNQYGGKNSEIAQASQYLTQRYGMGNKNAVALLTDIGTEELAHDELVGSMIHRLFSQATEAQIRDVGLSDFFSQHRATPFYCDSFGNSFNCDYIQCTGDPIADVISDIALERASRANYQSLLLQTDDVEIKNALRFLIQREIVHFQRFGELLDILSGLDNRQCENINENFSDSLR